jgi:hypothetical protein
MASSNPTVFDEMPKRKERRKITIIQMQGHPIQTCLKSKHNSHTAYLIRYM